MDERKPLSKAQFRLMRIIAFIIFALLAVRSYTGHAANGSVTERIPGECVVTFPLNAAG